MIGGETPVSDSGPAAGEGFDIWRDIQRWMEDINVMKFHATSSGMRLPAPTIQKLATLADALRGAGKASSNSSNGDGSPPITAGSCAKLTLDLHGDLLMLVAPSTPRTLAATEHRPLRDRILRPSMIGTLAFTAVASVGAFIATATMIERAGGHSPVLNQMNWLAAAILGAAFYSLFSAYKYVVRRTFDPQYTTVYWIRVILGGVAGVILANFGSDANTMGPTNQLGPPLLALLGGYSSEAVNRVLLRLTETLVTAVKGSSDAQVREKEKEVVALKGIHKDELIRERKRIIRSVQDTLTTAATPDDVVNRVKANLDSMLSN